MSGVWNVILGGDTEVTARKRYNGGGSYVVDGREGSWFVVGHCAPDGLKLARSPGMPWQVIMDCQRIAGSAACARMPGSGGEP